VVVILHLFPEKEALVLLRRIFFFSRKEAKALVLLRRRSYHYPGLGEADPGGFGGRAPQENRLMQEKRQFCFAGVSSFLEKKQKH
jgi:hypothetical protein